jgi:hypothetical protein
MQMPELKTDEGNQAAHSHLLCGLFSCCPLPTRKPLANENSYQGSHAQHVRLGGLGQALDLALRQKDCRALHFSTLNNVWIGASLMEGQVILFCDPHKH